MPYEDFEGEPREKPRPLHDPDNAELERRLCASISHYTSGDVNVQRIFRRLIALGWAATVVRKNVGQSCVLEKAGRRFESPQFGEASDAIVSAARMLLASRCAV